MLRTKTKVFDGFRIELLNDRKATAIFPEELHQLQLAKDSGDLACPFSDYDDTMDTTSECFDRFGEIRSMWQSDKRLLCAQVLGIFEWNLVTLLSFFGEVLEECKVFFVRMKTPGSKKEVLVQIPIVERANGRFLGRGCTDEEGLGAGFDKKLRIS